MNAALVAVPQRVQHYFAKKHDLTHEQAEQRFDELSEFLQRCAETEEPVSPTHEVDEVWHCFILHTFLYAQYCEEAFGRFIHHKPFLNEVASSASCNDGGGDGNCSNDCGQGDCNSGGDA